MEENTRSKEIDVIGIAKDVWKHKKQLYIFVGVFAVLGIVKALYTQKQYTTNVLLAPEINGSMGLTDNLSSLASMVGVDFGTNNKSIDAIYPEIYPDVLASSDFILGLFDLKVYTKDDPTERTYYQHLIKDRIVPFWTYPLMWIAKLTEEKEKPRGKGKGIDPFFLTKGQDKMVQLIRSNIGCSVDKKTSIISISVTDTDPIVSAVLADTIKDRLQQYIINYRTKKARNDLENAEKLCKEAHDDYVRASRKYAGFADANEGVVLQSYKLKSEDLESEMQLQFNAYSSLVQQVQIARAKVQERTPAFNVIQSPSVPLKPSGTRRLFIVVAFIILGVILDTAWIMWKRMKQNL